MILFWKGLKKSVQVHAATEDSGIANFEIAADGSPQIQLSHDADIILQGLKGK